MTAPNDLDDHEGLLYGLSESHWAGVPQSHRELYRLVRPVVRPRGVVNVSIGRLAKFLADEQRECEAVGGTFTLRPDFQRSNARWSQDQQSCYVEAVLRGHAPVEFKFNFPPRTQGDHRADIAPDHVELIDGLQRITALLKFVGDDLQVFDGRRCSDLQGTPFDAKRYWVDVAHFQFVRRHELIQFYLDLNEGGTVHEPAELDAARELRDASRADWVRRFGAPSDPVVEHAAGDASTEAADSAAGAYDRDRG